MISLATTTSTDRVISPDSLEMQILCNADQHAAGDDLGRADCLVGADGMVTAAPGWAASARHVFDDFGAPADWPLPEPSVVTGMGAFFSTLSLGAEWVAKLTVAQFAELHVRLAMLVEPLDTTELHS